MEGGGGEGEIIVFDLGSGSLFTGAIFADA